MKIESEIFKRICLAEMMFVALFIVSCSKTTCDLLKEQPSIVQKMSAQKDILVTEQVYDFILTDKHPMYASMSGAGDYIETENKDFFDILIEAIIKLVGGVVVFFVATYYLWRNESRYLRKKHTLEEVDKLCVIMENPNTRDPSMEGKLVCATATASTEEILSDPDFGIEINAISLSRKAKYYQWVEESETRSSKIGGKTIRRTVYKYKQDWVDEPIDSQSFHDSDYQDLNFVIIPMENKEQWAKKVSFGAYVLNDELKESMVPEPLNIDLDDKILEKWNNIVTESLRKNIQFISEVTNYTFTGPPLVSEYVTQEQNMTVSKNETPLPPKRYDYVHQENNVLYFGQEPNNPKVGDVSISFNKVLESVVTVVSQVAGDSFIPYLSRVEENYQKLVMGESNDDFIIADETKENKQNHWKIRIYASLATGVGLFMSFNILFIILTFLFSFIPFVTQYLQYVLDLSGYIFLLGCLLVGLSWSIINIFFAWIINLVIVNIDDWMG